MFPVACRPKGPANLEARLLGNVIGVGEKTWAGASIGANSLTLNKFTAVAGTIINIRIKCSNTTNIKVALYADNAGAPGTLLASSASTACVAGWNVIALTASAVLSAADYWLAVVSDTANRIYRSTSGGTCKYVAMTFADSFPNPPAGLSANTNDLALAGWGYPA